MTTLVLGTVGSIVGGAVGGPIGAQVGWLVGSLLGNLIDPPKIEGPRRSDLKLQVSEYGKPIPFVWGTGRIAGVVVDQTDLQEHEQTSGGKGGPEVTSYSYSASFAVVLAAAKAFGQEAISGVSRIWADGRLIWSSGNGEPMPCTLYLGTEDQAPDPTFEAIHGVGNVPAYRGLAYAVFADYMLDDFGNHIPLLEFEVYTATGDIPTRVSTFDANEHWPSDNLIGYTTYADGVLTVGYYKGPPTYTYRSESYNLDGSPVSSFGPQSLGVLSTVGGGVRNLGVAQLDGVWFQDGFQSTAILANPLGGAIDHSMMGGVYADGYIYGRCANPGTGHKGLAKWSCPDGVIDATSAIAVTVLDLGTSGSGTAYTPGTTNNPGKVYIKHVGDRILTEYDDSFNVLRTWDLSPVQSGVSVIDQDLCFHVYGDLLAVAATHTTLGDLCAVYRLEGGGVATLVGTKPMNTSYIVGLGTTPYIVAGDGVLSLDAPPGAALLSDIVADLSDMTQVGSYDVTELTDEVRWFAVANQMTVRNAIETLRKGFFFDAVESDDSVKFRKRGATDSILTIPDDDLDVRAYGQEPGAPLQTTRRREQGMPRNVTLRYIDVDMDYQTGAQHSPRLTTRSDSDVTLDLSIGFSASEALQKCWALQVGEWIERETFLWSTGRQYSWVEPCDVVTVRGRVIRVTNRTETPDGVIRWEGVQHRPSIYTQAQTGAPSEGWTPQPPGGERVATSMLLLDIPLLSETHFQNGFYVALYPAAAGTWTGAALYKSTDGGTTYASVAEATSAAIVGTVAAALPTFASGNIFDESNVVRVVLDDTAAELTTATTEAVLNGANLCALGTEATGWEVFQFRTATQVSTGVYDLSGLLRGRYGTEWRMASHAVSERFVLLSSVVNVDAPGAETGALRKYKPVSFGGALATATARDFTNTGVARKPFSPILVGGGRDSGGDLTMAWTPRRRGSGGWPDGVDLPATEPDNWQIEVFTDGTYATEVRAFGVTVPTMAYTSAQQTADFGSPQATVYWRVAQLGGGGLGYFTRAAT